VETAAGPLESGDTAAILHDAAHRTLALPERGVEIALLDWGGSGPLVLLHHANGFCKGVWGLVANALRARHRVIALDARGHGDSSKPDPADRDAYAWWQFAGDLVAVAQRLSAEEHAPIALGIGHSFGGTAMLGAAGARPELFRRLLLVDPVLPPPPHAENSRAAIAARMAEGARKRRARWDSRDEARAWWASRDFFASWNRRALDLYALDGLHHHADGGVALKCPPEVEATIFGNSGGVDALALARAVRTPTHLQWAARDSFPRAYFETIAEAMGDAVVETVDCGHLVTMERPDLVVAAALRLLA
jgi:pimeloyl-ACP methyl ester carboxylesterase